MTVRLGSKLAAYLLAAIAFCGLTCGQDAGNRSPAGQRVQQLVQMGRFADAISTGEDALKSANKNFQPSDPEYLDVLTALAYAYEANGENGRAAALLLEGIRELDGKPASAELYLQVARIDRSLHRDADSEDAAERALAIYKASIAEDDPRLAVALTMLASAKHWRGKFTEELPLLKRALRIASNAQGDYGRFSLKLTLEQLVLFWEVSGNKDRADEYRARVAQIPDAPATVRVTEPPGSPPPSNPIVLLYRARGAKQRGDFKEASVALERLVRYDATQFGEDHPVTQDAKEFLASCYYALHERSKAKSLLIELTDLVYQDFEHSFPFMNEQERLEFTQMFEARTGLFESFVHDFHSEDPELNGRMYDFALWSKELVLEGSRSLYEQLRTSHDPAVQQMRDELENLKRSFAMQAVSKSQFSPEATRLRSEIAGLERRITLRIGGRKEARLSWRDVKSSLRKDEAAIEILRFEYQNGRTVGNFLYYVALVVRPYSLSPSYVFLGDDHEVGERQVAGQRALLRAQARGFRIETPSPIIQSFPFWNGMEHELGGAKRIYISPDGVLNDVSFAVIPDSSGEPLIDNFDIRVISSTRDLLKSIPKMADSRTAVLVGDPDFDLSEHDRDQVAAQEFSKSPSRIDKQLNQAVESFSLQTHLDPLPGTATEIQDIGSKLRENDWSVRVFTRKQALKESIGTVQHPRVLHIATHAFFQARTGESELLGSFRTELAMFGAGLALAGANDGLRNRTNLNRSLLTAYEISFLDLNGTELVVLSACDTGLVDTVNGGEMFGLRRAFEIAGTRAVLMSLWSVPDKETSELLRAFYEAWLSGMDKHEALRAAQLKERALVRSRNNGQDLPYYWGAFVLVGN